MSSEPGGLFLVASLRRCRGKRRCGMRRRLCCSSRTLRPRNSEQLDDLTALRDGSCLRDGVPSTAARVSGPMVHCGCSVAALGRRPVSPVPVVWRSRPAITSARAGSRGDQRVSPCICAVGSAFLAVRRSVGLYGCCRGELAGLSAGSVLPAVRALYSQRSNPRIEQCDTAAPRGKTQLVADRVSTQIVGSSATV